MFRKLKALKDKKSNKREFGSGKFHEKVCAQKSSYSFKMGTFNLKSK